MTFLSAAHPTAGALVTAAPAPQLRASVVIPVKDEAGHLPATLHHLLRQTDARGRPLDPRTYEVLVLANNCSDTSAAVVRGVAARHPQMALHVVEQQLPPAQAHVGTARRLLMDEAHRRLTWVGQPRGVIATTDGDTEVDPTWVWCTMQEMNRGADAVGGRILVRQAHLSRHERRYHLRDVGYRFLANRLEALLDPDPADPWPRHYQSFGASLAITPATYAAVGGLPALPALEDVALSQALRRHDARLRRSLLVRVQTSGRQLGRTGWGMAAQLRVWTEMSEQQRPFLVESAAALRARFVGRYWLRGWWRYLHRHAPMPAVPFVRVARGLHQSSDLLLGQLGQAPTFGACWVPLEDALYHSETWRAHYPLVDIREATQALRAALQMRVSTPGR